MTMRFLAIGAGALLAAFALQSNAAQALSTKECSAKYKAAKDAGTLNNMKWNEFRKAQCGADAKADPTPAATPSAGTPPASGTPSASKTPAVTPAAGSPVFPKAVDSKYSKESAGKARMHTCRDQYQANKTNNANGGLKWIQKGGGYYSECNKSLKGQA